ncbi:MAG: hypothetical protein HY580_06695, partial [Nitrospinae bacterium]|nr:hypothetical protein [Nitrospinota bacterium]
DKVRFESGDDDGLKKSFWRTVDSLQAGPPSSTKVLDVGVFDGQSTRALSDAGCEVRGVEVLKYEKVLGEVERIANARNLSAAESEEMRRSLESIRDRIAFDADIRDLSPGQRDAGPNRLAADGDPESSRADRAGQIASGRLPVPADFFPCDYVTAFLPNPRVASLFVFRAKDFLGDRGCLLLTLDNVVLARTTAAILEMEGWMFAGFEMAPETHPRTSQSAGLAKPYHLMVSVKRPDFSSRQRSFAEDKALGEKRRKLFSAVDVLYNAMHLEGGLRGKPVGRKYQNIQDLLASIFSLRDQFNAAGINYEALSQSESETRNTMQAFKPLADFVWTALLL